MKIGHELVIFTTLALGKSEKSGNALVTFIANNVFFAGTFSIGILTILVDGTIRIAVTL